MHLSVLAALVFGAVCAQSAFPIGRIGNSTKVGDSVEGYSAAVPSAFQNIAAVADGGALLQSGLFAASPPRPVDINILSFRSQYPQLASKGRSSILDFFMTSPDAHYSQLATANGALALFGRAEGSYIGITVCGDGRGYVMFALKLDMVETAMKEVMKQTVFERPCQK